MDLSVNKSAKSFMRSQFTMWYAEEILLLHQGAKSNNQQHQPCQQTEDDNRNNEVEYIETDEDEHTEWRDTTETDEDLQVTTITHAANHRKRTDTISESEFEIVNMSTARMKSLGGKWLVKMFDYMEGYPAILINGFKAAGITEALQINGPVDSSTLDHYDSFTKSEDLDTLIVVASAKIYCLWILYSKIRNLTKLNKTPPLSSLTRNIMEGIPKISITHDNMTILCSYLI